MKYFTLRTIRYYTDRGSHLSRRIFQVEFAHHIFLLFTVTKFIFIVVSLSVVEKGQEAEKLYSSKIIMMGIFLYRQYMYCLS